MRRFARVFRSGILWVLVLALTVAGAMALYAYMYQKPTYLAETELFIKLPDGASTADYAMLARDVEAIGRSTQVIKQVADALPPDALSHTRIGVKTVSGSHMMIVSARGDDEALCSQALKVYLSAVQEKLALAAPEAKAVSTETGDIEAAVVTTNKIMLVLITFGIAFAVFLIIFMCAGLLSGKVYAGDRRDIGADVLLCVPEIKTPRKKTVKPPLMAVGRGAREQVKLLALRLSARASESVLRSIVFCSIQPDEGKTSVMALLGSELALQGKRVLLIDMDCNSPTLGMLLGLRGARDLIHYLAREASLESVILPTGQDGLFFIDQCHKASVTFQLSSSKAFASFMNRAYEEFDFILFDAPPTALMTDAAALGSALDATVLVAADGRNEKRRLTSEIEAIKSSGCSLMGVVMSRVKQKKDKLYTDDEIEYAAPRGAKA